MVWTPLRRAGLLALTAVALLPSPAAAQRPDVRADGTVLFETAVYDEGAGRPVLFAVRPDGTADPGFGDAGAVRARGQEADVVVLPDGSLHVLRLGGDCTNVSPHSCYSFTTLTGYDAAGSELSTTRFAQTDPGFTYYGVELEPSGATLLEMSSYSGLTRRSPDGEVLDSTFAGEEPSALAPMGGGAVVGSFHQVRRFDADLDPVESFGDDGVAEVPFSPEQLVADGDAVLAASGDQPSGCGPTGRAIRTSARRARPR
jgi:hypothetical protein